MLVTPSFPSEVSSPPRFIEQPPADELLFEVSDRPIYIKCKAQGEPAPKYRWIKDGKPYKWEQYDQPMFQLPESGTLVVYAPKDADQGHYQCFAENEHGIATSNSVFLRKSTLEPFKDTSLSTRSGNEGEPFKLECQIPDGWPKLIPYWLILYDHGSFKNINNSRMTTDLEGNLWFSNLTKADATNDFTYACAVTSSFRHEYKIGPKFRLVVVPRENPEAENRQSPVLQFGTKKNLVTVKGQKQKLYCIYSGTPAPQVVWSKNGELIEFSDRIIQSDFGKSLTIKKVDLEDEGVYTCAASNGVKNNKSYSISLKMFAAPYFTVEPEISNVAEGETAEIRCEAAGIPQPEIAWIHNGKPVAEAAANPRRKIENNKIVIEGAIKNDTGNYGCNATNSLGYVYKDVYVYVI